MFYKLIRKLVYNLLWVLYPLTYIIPRKRNIWVFGGKYNGYFDNVKYMFEYVSENEPTVKAIWITRSTSLIKELRRRGFKAQQRYSIAGFITAAEAGAYIYSFEPNDINLWLRRGALQLNLWHGVGLKKLGIDNTQGLNKFMYNPKGFWQRWFTRLHSPQMMDRSFYMLATSKIMLEHFSRSFMIPKNQLMIAGYPRLLPFYEINEKPQGWEHYKSVFLYMPTFRDNDPLFLSTAFPSIEILNERCKELNALFLLKLHPMMPKEESQRFEGFSNLEIMDQKADLYPIMKHTTALITDYSSVFVDYAVLSKPIIIYTHDYDDYISNSRELHMPLTEFTQGKEISNFNKLLIALQDPAGHQISNKKLVDTFWEKDSKYAQRDITKWLKIEVPKYLKEN